MTILKIKNMVCPRCIMAVTALVGRYGFLLLSWIGLQCVTAQTEVPDSIYSEHALDGVTVKAPVRTKLLSRTENTELIGQGQLIRAACCNLGESFTTNPSVDVSYSDAATGAKQIRLLGLSGTYVQLLTENVPNLRGAALPYALGYVPGPWMQSIQVSKGASSVKNGYESTTGQINIEYLKPQGTDGVRANAYLDSQLKYELNADASVHLTDRLSTSLLLHYEDRQRDHDADGDGFMDMPKQRQIHGMWRMAYVSPLWISQFSVQGLRDERVSGMSHHAAERSEIPHYGVNVQTDRYVAQWKNGFTLDADHNTSLALMLQGSLHDTESQFGSQLYQVRQKNGYAQLMFETDWTEQHNWAVGASVNHDGYEEETTLDPSLKSIPRETTSGLYLHYTYRLEDRLTVMPGVRWDYSSHYGGFFTPRLHVKYVPVTGLTLRASAGKGYRSPHALAEQMPMLASGRTFHQPVPLQQEEAWNFGFSTGWMVPIAGRDLELNAEYYYTDFQHQLVMEVDEEPGAPSVYFKNLDGKSYSHTLQLDATYPIFEGFTATGAFRYNDARTTYAGVLRHRPLTSRFKGLLTCSYKTPMELWQFDVTGQLHGHGEYYDHTPYPTYFQLQAQVTREFPHFSLYVGGENLTNYRIPEPIKGAHNPWSSSFDATQIWGPTEGAMFYIGVRFKLEKL